MKEASEGDMKGILGYTEEPLVSSDFTGMDYSSMFDAPLTYVMDDLVKVCSWYDNEWGYSVRMVDLTELVAQSL